MTVTPNQCKFFVWLYGEELPQHINAAQFSKCAKAIDAVAVLFERQLNGDSPTEEEFIAAGDAAEDAANAAGEAAGQVGDVAGDAADAALFAAFSAGYATLSASLAARGACDHTLAPWDLARAMVFAHSTSGYARRRIDDKLNEFIENEA